MMVYCLFVRRVTGIEGEMLVVPAAVFGLEVVVDS